MSAPRFVLVLDRWAPERGGLEAYARDVAQALRARGARLRLVTGRAEGPVPEGVEVCALGALGAAFDRAADAALAGEAPERVLAFRHPGPRAGVFLALGGLFAAALERRARAAAPPLRPVKRLARALSPATRRRLARERAFFAGGAERLFVAPSPLVLADRRRLHPGYRGREACLGLPVDPKRFAPPAGAGARRRLRAELGLPEEAILLLFVGHDARRKGLSAALAVLARLRARRLDARLLVAGRARTPRRPAVLPLGCVDPAPYYRAADLLLHPSFEDSFGLCVAEALACGLPVVTTAATGASAWIRDPSLGRVVADPRDTAALDAAALALLAERSPERALARRACVADLAPELHFEALWALLQGKHPPAASRAS